MTTGTHRLLTRGSLVVLIAWLAASPLHAQGFVSGHVLDAASSEPIADVTVRALDAASVVRASVLSDSTGFFRLPLPPGSYTLSAERIGYATLNTDAVQVRRDETVDVALRMGISPVAVEPLVVRSRNRTPVAVEVFHQRMQRGRDLGQGRFITRQDIEQTSVGSVNDLLARDLSLHLVPGILGGDMIQMELRGRRRCVPAFFLDGVRLYQPDGGNLVQPDALEGVEIYSNEMHVPPELASPNGCGAVALWTRADQGNPFTLRKIAMAGAFVALALLLMSR